MSKKTLWFNEVGLEDVKLVGGKNASLGEMIRNLSELGIRVPNGFAVTTDAYQYFLEHNNLVDSIRNDLEQIDYNDHVKLCRIAQKIRRNIQNGEFPKDLENEILEKYKELSLMYKFEGIMNQEELDMAVRSSSIVEDIDNASGAGNQSTYLNTRGKKNILEKIKSCFASLYNERAIDYRHHFKLDINIVKISVGIQKMARSDLGSAGVAFSICSDSGNKDVVVINGSFGLGEMVVSGAVTPDEIVVFKPTYKQGYKSIIDKKLGEKVEKMVYSDDQDKRCKIIPVKSEKYHKFCITDEQALELAGWVIKLEEYYSKRKGYWCPVDTEWAIDGLSNELFLVQCRAETIHSNADKNILVKYNFKVETPDPILEGVAVGERIGAGKVNVMLSLDNRDEGKEFKQGDILVAPLTDPDWECYMRISSAIICENGGRTCHSSIIARELGIPAIVGVKGAITLLKDGQEITVSCCQGEKGYIYEGLIPFEKKELVLDSLPKPPVKIMMNIGNPEEAFSAAKLPNDGVSLTRMEFILSNYIKVHPMALLHSELVTNKEKRADLDKIIKGYNSGEEYFLDKLTYGVARIAAAFYPRDVILRASDLRSNEYSQLFCGEFFENEDDRNPMIGFRGCSRYYDKRYKEAFALECKVVKRVREQLGLTNLIFMLPFCRTVTECLKVQEVMSENGLKRGENGFKLYLMAEIPSNFILAEKFLEHCDGFSIGSNDITQLMLGVDRDSELLQHIYDERDESVKEVIKMAIKACKKVGKKIGICGQVCSDRPEMAAWLVEQGIDSIGLVPETIIKTILMFDEIKKN